MRWPRICFPDVIDKVLRLVEVPLELHQAALVSARSVEVTGSEKGTCTWPTDSSGSSLAPWLASHKVPHLVEVSSGAHPMAPLQALLVEVPRSKSWRSAKVSAFMAAHFNNRSAAEHACGILVQGAASSGGAFNSLLVYWKVAS